MGLFTSINTNQQNFEVNSLNAPLTVDLTRLHVGSTPVGKEPWDGDFFTTPLKQFGHLNMEQSGYELTLDNGLLSSAFLTLNNFNGTLLVNDQATTFASQTDVISLFGEPYWTDLDDDEVILFYEYHEGSIELQFEFPDGQTLGYITLTKDGVLSEAAQRESYGVTKTWPPAKKE